MSHLYIEELLRPILTCLTDTDSRVRYYACESLYNILKVSKHLIVPIFNDIFCSMGMVVTDLDQNVRTAAELLDRLLKVIKSFPPSVSKYVGENQNHLCRSIDAVWFKLSHTECCAFW